MEIARMINVFLYSMIVGHTSTYAYDIIVLFLGYAKIYRVILHNHDFWSKEAYK